MFEDLLQCKLLGNKDQQ